MTKKVVLYDFSSALGCRKVPRQDQGVNDAHGELVFFFPQTMAAVFAQHRAHQDHVIIVSGEYFKAELLDVFSRENIALDPAWDLLDIEALQDEPLNVKEILVEKKKAELNIEVGIIVDHDVNVIHRAKKGIVLIPVPSKRPDAQPMSQNYLQVVLMDARLLVETVAPNTAKLASQASLKVNNPIIPAYDRWIKGAKLIKELYSYRDGRAADQREYTSRLARLFKPKHQNRSSIIEASDRAIMTVWDSMVLNRDFDRKRIEKPGANSGDLKKIVRSYNKS